MRGFGVVFAMSLLPVPLFVLVFFTRSCNRGTLLKKGVEIRSCSRLEVGQKMIASVSIFTLRSDLGLL